MFHSFFRTKAKPTSRSGRSGSGGTVNSSSSSRPSNTKIPSQRRWEGFNPKLRIYTPTQARPVNQAAFCTPSCPVEEDLHRTGLYLHNGELNHSLSFLFGANNPPPDVRQAHDKLLAGKASEEEEELLLSFLAHHPFYPGNVTDKIWWTAEEPAGLMMLGNPLSFTDPELPLMTFEPIRVAPIKPAD